MDTVRTLPEWKELRNILQQRGVDVERYFERIKEFFGLSRRGNFLNDWKHKGDFLYFVLTCIKFHDAEYHIDTIIQLTNIHSLTYGRKL